MGKKASTARRYLPAALRIVAIGILGFVLISSVAIPVETAAAQEQESGADEQDPAVQEAEAVTEAAAEAEDERPGAVHIAGEKPVFRGLANDLFAWAWLPEVAGTVEDNTFMGGQRAKVQSGATLGGDLFIFAQTGTIAGQVGGDVYCLCQELVITESGSVGGRVESLSEILTISGDVEGPIDFSGGILTIDGTLRRGGSAQTGVLEIGPGASVGGVLEYESPNEATVGTGAEITGELRHTVPAVIEGAVTEDDDDDGWFSISWVLWKFWHFASSFLVGSLLLAVGGSAARAPALRLARRPALGLGLGFVVFIVVPVGAFIFMVFVIGIPLGVLTMMAYFIALYLARLVAAQTFGTVVLRQLRDGKEPCPYVALALGLVIFFVLVAIPYMGFLLWLATIFLGLGGLFMALRPLNLDDSPLEVVPAS